MSEPASTRNKLIEAGLEQLLDRGETVLSRGLNVAEIAERAGVAQKTFYATFQSKERYIDELVVSLAVPPTRIAGDLTEMIQRSIIEASGDPRETVRAVCRWDFRQVRDDPEMVSHLAILVLAAKHRGAMSALRKAYALYDDAGIRAYEAILARWGASLRAPFTVKSMAVTLTALVEGLAIRHLADPESIGEELFGNVVLALVGSVVDGSQGHQHIDDLLAPLAAEMKHSYELNVLDTLPEEPRKSVIEAARAEFGGRGYFATTLVGVSARSGVPVPVLKQLFPSKASIIVSALRGDYEVLRSGVADDTSLGMSAVDVIMRYLTRLAALAIREKAFVEALLMVAAHDTSSASETAVEVKSELDFPALIEPVIARAQAAGVLVGSVLSYDAAAMLTNALFLRCFTRPGLSPRDQAETVGKVLLDGIVNRPNPARA